MCRFFIFQSGCVVRSISALMIYFSVVVIEAQITLNSLCVCCCHVELCNGILWCWHQSSLLIHEHFIKEQQKQMNLNDEIAWILIWISVILILDCAQHLLYFLLNITFESSTYRFLNRRDSLKIKHQCFPDWFSTHTTTFQLWQSTFIWDFKRYITAVNGFHEFAYRKFGLADVQFVRSLWSNKNVS